MVEQVDDLIRALTKLPGYGRRSAERATLALLRKPEQLLDPLAAALQAARKEVCCCPVCGGFTSQSHVPCDLCADLTRDDGLLCVVEDPADISQIEGSGGFHGRYHALMGKLSPSKKTGPAELRLGELESRVAKGGIREVLIAVSTDVEGDNTAAYILELLKPYGVKLSRLAFGLPADSGVGYSDPLTLKRAITGRMNL